MPVIPWSNRTNGSPDDDVPEPVVTDPKAITPPVLPLVEPNFKNAGDLWDIQLAETSSFGLPVVAGGPPRPPGFKNFIPPVNGFLNHVFVQQTDGKDSIRTDLATPDDQYLKPVAPPPVISVLAGPTGAPPWPTGPGEDCSDHCSD